jgi:cell division protein ZapA (FtsZ GTPase activity inhibitor)
MDLISFILGMSIVVVIAVAVVAVIAFVRVNKQKEEIKQLEQILGREIEHQMRDRDKIVDDIYRTIDSRLDKLESRLNAARHKD